MRIAAAIVAALLVAGGLALWVAIGLPPAGRGHPVTVIVREGDGIAVIARRLESAGVVRSAIVFRAWARVRGRDRALHPGRHRFDGPTDLDAVLETLAASPVFPEITIPEGLTVREIAGLLDTRGFGAASEVLCLAADPDFLLAAGVPGGQLEGYLFPDTYRLHPAASVAEILDAMVRRFHERFDAERHRRAHMRQMTVNEVVTLASIIEKETGMPAERPVIAAVFTNRLRLDMPLQSDPTVIYGLPDFDGNLTRADLTRPSPYNTYVTRGLPPGPIANPGLAAIDAALAPSDSRALYFVSRNDGSHVFSETLAEHNRAVDRYQRAGASPRGANIPVDSTPERR